MQKALAYEGQGLLDRNLITTEILSQASTKSPVVLEISKHISSGSLTDALDLLEEKSGITGDVALFTLASLQVLSGVSQTVDKCGQPSSENVVGGCGSSKKGCPHLSRFSLGGEA